MEVFVPLIVFFLYIVTILYVLSLLDRLVRAVERIANKLDER
ncbi:hypothetical protein [Scytonema sp. PCC 10023]